MAKVLIVDDDLAFSEMLSEILKDEGLEVVVQHDGATGLQTALAEHPDLVMCDFMMPRMTGVAMLAELRKDAWGAAVPVIMLTNMNQPELDETDGAVEVLLKTDWTLDKLAEKVKAAVAA